MEKAVLSMAGGMEREVSSGTRGPRREADWVVERMGMERDWEARMSFWVVDTLGVEGQHFYLVIGKWKEGRHAFLGIPILQGGNSLGDHRYCVGFMGQ